MKLEWNEIDFKMWEAGKANGIESTSAWFQTYADINLWWYGSLCEVEGYVNLFVQLKERLVAP